MPKAVSDWWRKNKTEGLPKKTFPGMKNPNLRDPKENKWDRDKIRAGVDRHNRRRFEGTKPNVRNLMDSN